MVTMCHNWQLILNEALEAANNKNINPKKVSIVSMGSVKPLDKDFQIN